jgi:inner membrane transporter RhtA
MLPPRVYFLVSAVFHYLGPAFAVLLFARVEPLGVAWLRIVSAAVVFALWRRLPRLLSTLDKTVVALGLALAGMNAVFYLAIDRLPLATVGAIEFLGPIAVAALGLRGARNLAALGLAVAGVLLLTDVRLTGEPLGFVLAFANCGLFVAYIVLGKRIAAGDETAAGDSVAAGDGAATGGGTAGSGAKGIDRLGASMLVAAVAVAPVGAADAAVAFTHPGLLAAGVAVGLCSSVIPYVCDQLALARLDRSTFALLLSLLPATATLIGIVVLAQIPTPAEVAGIALVICGVALHSAKATAGSDGPACTGHPVASPPRLASPGRAPSAGRTPHRR